MFCILPRPRLMDRPSSRDGMPKAPEHEESCQEANTQKFCVQFQAGCQEANTQKLCLQYQSSCQEANTQKFLLTICGKYPRTNTHKLFGYNLRRVAKKWTPIGIWLQSEASCQEANTQARWQEANTQRPLITSNDPWLCGLGMELLLSNRPWRSDR